MLYKNFHHLSLATLKEAQNVWVNHSNLTRWCVTATFDLWHVCFCPQGVFGGHPVSQPGVQILHRGRGATSHQTEGHTSRRLAVHQCFEQNHVLSWGTIILLCFQSSCRLLFPFFVSTSSLFQLLFPGRRLTHRDSVVALRVRFSEFSKVHLERLPVSIFVSRLSKVMFLITKWHKKR